MNKEVKYFLVSATIIFIIWVILYNGYLKPRRVLDQFITNTTAKVTSNVLSLKYDDVSWFEANKRKIYKEKYGYKEYLRGQAIIKIGNNQVISISDSCNALELFILYLSFLICIKTSLVHQIKFAFVGIFIIFNVNVIRCVSLAWLFMEHKSLVEFAHHYLFNTIVYIFIFILWIFYVKKARIVKQI